MRTDGGLMWTNWGTITACRDGCFNAIQIYWNTKFLFRWKIWPFPPSLIVWMISKCATSCLSQFQRKTPSLGEDFFTLLVKLLLRHQFQRWCGHSGVMFHCRILLSSSSSSVAADLCKGVVIKKSVDGRTRASSHASQHKTSFIIPSSCTASVNLAAAIIEI